MAEDRTFKNIQSAVAFLREVGFRASKSSAYVHQKEGKLRLREDGLFHEKDVIKYGKHWLKRTDPSIAQGAGLERLQQRRLQAEILKNESQAKHWAFKTEIESGRYVPRAQLELELAARASIFRTDIEYFAQACSPEIINFVNGDMGKAPELITFLLDKALDWLNRYAERDRQWEIVIPPKEFETLPGEEGDAEKAEDDEE